VLLVFVLICPFNLISHLYYSSVDTSDGSCNSLVPVAELTRLALPINMLPAELSDALGVSLSGVLARYYSGSDMSERGHLIGDALDRKRLEEEGEEWLV
jgi:hypothetical protein